MSISSISSSQTYQVSASNATKSSSLSSEQKTLVEDVLSQYEDTSSFTAFNTILDYTNQIVNLKDDAKSEVMSILEEYNASQEQQDAQKSVVNSLNDILNKPQNYNRISFYV